MDTCFNYLGEEAYFSSDERKWINKINKLKEQHPSEITILKNPEDNDGCIYCKLPSSWLKVIPKRENTMTDEQKAAAAERLRKHRKGLL
jgi:hypothetical protein